VGRRDPHVLRTRPVAQEGSLHGHHTGRLPRRAAAGQPRLPGQRPAGRLVGVAGAVPAVGRADRRGHRDPAQGRGVCCPTSPPRGWPTGRSRSPRR
jgi:hypothetical protein